MLNSFTLVTAMVTKKKWYITDSFIVFAWLANISNNDR